MLVFAAVFINSKIFDLTMIFAVAFIMAVIISISLFVILIRGIQRQDKSGEKKYSKNREGAAELKRNKPAGRYRGSMNPTPY